jgi:tRNA/tmRNA/rRNA uracil-C5-methylase (TrmA/RlmC/RlmD family)
MNIEIKIEKLVFGGAGLGFVDGKACFVENALPGETVLARVTSNKKNFCKAGLLEVLKASPHRLTPPCPYIRQCGGCQYQHLTYAEELRWKENQVRESFLQALKLDPALIEPVQFAAREYGYRQSVTLHRISSRSARERLAYIGKDNRSKTAVDRCLLADERLQGVFVSEHSLAAYEKDRTFKLSEDGRIFTSDKPEEYRAKMGESSLLTNSRCFFQNNHAVAKLAVDKIAGWVAQANPAGFLDLYAGVGTFSVLCAQNVPAIFCFEENPRGVECLRRNFAERKLPLRKVWEGPVEKTFPVFARENRGENVFVFLDPPRRGTEPGVAKLLASGKAGETIVYLACDLAILIRDLRIILSEGAYEIKSVAAFDMFPRTKHIEVAALLMKKPGS